jgi:DNA-binding transcriptional regulator YbjK
MGHSTAPRRIDRQRRERIIQGALTAIGEHGVEGLTHRRTAEAAGVPLSAPSYYFDSIEDLLEAAMREAAERDSAALRKRFGPDVAADDLPALLAAHIAEGVRHDRTGLIITSELYVAALRRPGLREIADAWDETWMELLTPLVGRSAALAATMVTGGMAQRALFTDGRLDVAELEAVLRVALGLDRADRSEGSTLEADVEPMPTLSRYAREPGAIPPR